MKFRKKPIVIEAIQWRYDTIANIDEIAKFIGYRPKYHDATLSIEKRLIIQTLEGISQALLGDWIIKGIKGEFYPCKPDIFKETYGEIVEEKDERNPAHFCFNCDKYLGHRGFCSQECHDKWYDEMYPAGIEEKRTLSDKIIKPCSLGKPNNIKVEDVKHHLKSYRQKQRNRMANFDGDLADEEKDAKREFGDLIE